MKKEEANFEEFVLKHAPHVIKDIWHKRLLKVLSNSYGKQSGILLQTYRGATLNIFVNLLVQFRLQRNEPCLLYVTEPLTFKRKFEATTGIAINLEKIQSVDNPVYKVTLK